MKYIYSKLLILMILNLSLGYSQDIEINLPNNLARLIINDLVLGDQSQEELFLTKQQIDVLNSKILLKDDIIFNQMGMIKNYENIIKVKEEQLFTSTKLSDQLNLDLKKQKAKTKLFKLGGTTVVIGAIVLAIL